MVQVISNLGGGAFSAITIVRPVLVSIAFAVVVPVACLFVLKPCTLWLNNYRESHPSAPVNGLLRKTQTAFTLHTALLIALTTGATYAGTSNLFAAYIAGATISWWDSEVPHVNTSSGTEPQPTQDKAKVVSSRSDEPLKNLAGPSKKNGATAPSTPDNSHLLLQQPTTVADLPRENSTLCGAAIYEQYYHEAVSKILQPLFFASIGFSIPITRMFRGAIVWRGIVYTIFMAFAKVVCGVWLIRLSFAPIKTLIRRLTKASRFPPMPHLWGKSRVQATSSQAATTATPERPAPEVGDVTSTPASSTDRRSSPNAPKPFSVHPPLILALAMCARGEIGFLISGVAESKGIFSPSGAVSSEPSDIFLVVTWAIVLCTISGPLGVGLSVRRVKKLQGRKNKQQEGAGRDVLGVWGVE